MSPKSNALKINTRIHVPAFLLIFGVISSMALSTHSPVGDLGRLLSSALSMSFIEAITASQPHPPITALMLWLIAPIMSWKTITLCGASFALVGTWYGIWRLNRLWGEVSDLIALASFCLLCGSGWLWTAVFNLPIDLFGVPLLLLYLGLLAPKNNHGGIAIGLASAGILMVKYSFAFFIVPTLLAWTWHMRNEKEKVMTCAFSLCLAIGVWLLVASPNPLTYIFESVTGKVDTASLGKTQFLFCVWAWKTGFGWIGLCIWALLKKKAIPTYAQTTIIGSVIGFSLLPLQEIRYLLPMAAPVLLWVCRSREMWAWVWIAIGTIGMVGQAWHRHIETEPPSWRPMHFEADWAWYWPMPHPANRATDSGWKKLPERADWIVSHLPPQTHEVMWFQHPHPKQPHPADQIYFIKQLRPEIHAIIANNKSQRRKLLKNHASKWLIVCDPMPLHEMALEKKWTLIASTKTEMEAISIWKASH